RLSLLIFAKLINNFKKVAIYIEVDILFSYL
ncbi:unnamed protein product, partial [marine sediment metagenome]